MSTELIALISLLIVRMIVPVVLTVSLGSLLSRWEARHDDA